jgi:hypothetical protein
MSVTTLVEAIDAAIDAATFGSMRLKVSPTTHDIHRYYLRPGSE